MKKEYVYKYNSDIGILTLLSDGQNITGLWIKEASYSKDAKVVEVTHNELAVFEKVKEWLDCYFSGKEPEGIIPIKSEGTDFRKSVWKLLCEIPYGEVITYGDIAKKIALQTGKKKMSSQAVGGAVGSNPISILIPCHRVIGANGNLTGYGGGLDVKVRLLKIEGMDMRKFHMPKK